ncbi:MAG: NAD(P)-dependent alcohol dehydrogenase [Bacteroidota bacterium]
MKAAIWTAYGPPEVLVTGELPKPVPKENEILIKVVASTVTAGDCELRRFDIATWIWLPVRLFIGIFKPRIKVLGQEFAGIIEAVGAKVKSYEPGMKVFSTGGVKMGGYGEYVCLPEKHPVAPIPQNLPLKECAAISTGGTNGVHFVRNGEVKAGDKVLINGAGGSIGTISLQLCKHLGAEVSCVDSKSKHEMLTTLGADHVIDYREQDFTTLDAQYDVIIDIVGLNHLNSALNKLRANGHIVLGNPTFTSMIWGLWINKTTNKKAKFSLAGENKEDNLHLVELIEKGIIKIPIDREFDLDQIVEAHHYVESGEKKGNVLVNVFLSD